MSFRVLWKTKIRLVFYFGVFISTLFICKWLPVLPVFLLLKIMLFNAIQM